LELAFREVHIEAQLMALLRRDRMVLGLIDPQPRPYEVSIHPPGHPGTLPKSALHKHEVIQVWEQLDAIPPPEHRQFSHFF
jgi:hypothetical protein